MRHTFELNTGLVFRGGDTCIKMDGKELRGVRRVKVEADCEDVTEITITFLPEMVSVIGEAAVKIEVEDGECQRCDGKGCEACDPMVGGFAPEEPKGGSDG
jgi:hypothetical protein